MQGRTARTLQYAIWGGKKCVKASTGEGTDLRGTKHNIFKEEESERKEISDPIQVPKST